MVLETLKLAALLESYSKFSTDRVNTKRDGRRGERRERGERGERRERGERGEGSQ